MLALVHIPDDDVLYRHAIHPLIFRGKSVFVPHKLFLLKDKGDRVVSSFAWEKYLPSIEDVHSMGCRLAAKMNERHSESKGRPLRDDERRIYCGAYLLRAEGIRSLLGQDNLDELQGVDVYHLEEDGEVAHTEVCFVLRPDSDLESVKTALLDRLWNLSAGPRRHTCDCDRGIADHPSGKVCDGPCGDEPPKVNRLASEAVTSDGT